MRDRAWWKIYALMTAAAVLAFQFLPSGGWWNTGWQVGIGWASSFAAVIGSRRLRGWDKAPWLLFALGVFSNSTGIAVSFYCQLYLGSDTSPTPADPFFLLLYPPCVLGLILMIKHREHRWDWAAAIDATTITIGFGLLAWVYVIEPTSHVSSISMAGRVIQAAYPIGDLILLGLVARLLRGRRVSTANWLVSASLIAFLAGDVCWVVIGRLNVDVDSSPALEHGVTSVYLVAFALIGVAALHPSAWTLHRADGSPADRVSRALLIVLVAAALIAPVVLLAEAHTGGVENGTAIALASGGIFLLVVARMIQLLRQVEEWGRLVRELSARDELTGLLNRRAWNDRLPRELENARRDGVRLSLAVIDIDHFKSFNDRYGHPAGDRLLKEASAAWSGVLRETDTLARWGGEEFVLLLPDAGEADASALVARALAATPADQTFSAGLAAWNGSESSDDLIARADAALYEAKNSGRNRTVIAATALTRGE